MLTPVQAEGKAALAKAKAAEKEKLAIDKAKADFEKEIEALTKLAALKREDAIKKASADCTKVRGASKLKSRCPNSNVPGYLYGVYHQAEGGG